VSDNNVLFDLYVYNLGVQERNIFANHISFCEVYHAVRDDLAWCQPFAKFMTIKGVVFMTFWQGLAINILFHVNKSGNMNADDDGDDSTSDSSSNDIYSATTIQHILICMEMLFFSVAHWCVFPAEEWEDGYKVRFYEGPGFGFKDFAQDINLIIDSGKQSIQARRERMSGPTQSDNSSATEGPTNVIETCFESCGGTELSERGLDENRLV